jgi:hypothetical protein
VIRTLISIIVPALLAPLLVGGAPDDDRPLCPDLNGPASPLGVLFRQKPLSPALPTELPARLPSTLAGTPVLDADGALVSSEELHLRALGEPDLSAGVSEGLTVIRLLYLRSFHSPILVRVEGRESGWVLQVQRLTGTRGWHPSCTQDGVLSLPCQWLPGEPVNDGVRWLSAKEVTRVERLMADASFWSTPAAYTAPPPAPPPDGVPPRIQLTTACVDGSTWVIEGVDDSRYHAVYRDCEFEPSLQDLMCGLLGLVGEIEGPIY